MGNDSSIDLKANYICLICQKILIKPYILPCSCSTNICQDHIRDSRRQTIRCSRCNTSFNLKSESFIIIENVSLQNRIGKCFYLTRKEQKLKSILDKNLSDLQKLLADFNQAISAISLDQYEKFANIKNEIDIKREFLINEVHTRIDVSHLDTVLNDIQTVSAQMLNDVEKLEDNFWTTLNSLKPSKNEIYIQIEKSKLEDLFRNPYLSMETLENLKHDYVKELNMCHQNYNKFQLFKNDLIKLSLVDPKTFDKLNSFKSFLKHKHGQISSIVTCSFSQNSIYIWDLNKNLIVKSFKAHMDSVMCLEVYELNKSIISGSKDKLIKIWSLETGACLQTLQGHTSWIWCLKMLINGQRLASGSTDACVKIWDLKNGACISTLKLHTAAILCLEQLDNEFLLSGGSDTSIRMWNLNEYSCAKTIYYDYTSSVTCLKVLKSNRNLILAASGYDDNVIRIWNLNKGECLQSFHGHSGWINCLEFTKSRYLISVSIDEEIRIWDLNEGKCIQMFDDHVDSVNWCRINAFGQLITISKDKTIRVWDLDWAECIETINTDFGFNRFEILNFN